jgi:hypothetical protein
MKTTKKLQLSALRRAILPLLVALALTPAASAQMTDAQKNAIKSSCRSDYMSNCMSVRPGGIEALQCLQRNMAKLSPGCQTAVNATMPKAPPPAAAAPPPAPPPPKAAAAPAAATTAIVTAPPPPARMATPSGKIIEPPAKKVNATAAAPTTPKPAAKPAAPQAKQAVAAPPPAAASPPPPPVVDFAAKIEAMPLPKRLTIVRFCRTDQKAICPTVKSGAGRIATCLMAHQQALSPGCRQVLARALR